MKKSRSFKVLAVALISFCCSPATDKTTATDSATTVTETVKGGDALPSWNDGDVKKRLTDFVINATKDGGSSFIPVTDRIAVFENDGTLWSEQPLYFQFFYSFDKIRQMASQHPEWKTKEPFKSEGNIKSALTSGKKACSP